MLIKIYFVVKPLKMVEYKVVKLQVPFFKISDADPVF